MKEHINSLRIRNTQKIKEINSEEAHQIFSLDDGQYYRKAIDMLTKYHITHLNLTEDKPLNIEALTKILQAGGRCSTLHTLVMHSPTAHKLLYSEHTKDMLEGLSSIQSLKHIRIHGKDAIPAMYMKEIAKLKKIESVSFPTKALCDIDDFQNFVNIPSLKNFSYNEFNINRIAQSNTCEQTTNPYAILLSALSNNTNLVVRGLNNNEILQPFALEQYLNTIYTQLSDAKINDSCINIISEYIDFTNPNYSSTLYGSTSYSVIENNVITDLNTTPIIGEDEQKDGGIE